MLSDSGLCPRIWTAPDGSFAKSVTKEGKGFETPGEGARCSVHISCEIVGMPLEAAKSMKLATELTKSLGIPTGNAELTLSSACGNESQIIFENFLRSMKPGEEASIDLNPFPYIGEQHEPSTSKISQTITATLKSFQQGKNVWEMDPQEKIERAKTYKATGVEYFKKGDTESAFTFFSRSLKYLICARTLVGTLVNAEESNTLRCNCYLNMSACQLKFNNHSSAVRNCTKALNIDPDNVKALYRRSQSYCKLREYQKARDDLTKAIGIEPKNSALQKLLSSLQQK